jgi:FixJ family two-component response regulator
MLARSRSVAVVEDDPTVLKAVSRLLTLHGFESKEFTSAEAFLESGAADEASCVVVDICLGGMSGIELRRRLAASDCTLPVIFITGSDDEATRRDALAAGCVAYLHKPFEAHLLIGAIEQAG